MRKKNGRAYGHITVTGGEPFIRSDFLELLDILSANRKYFSFAILTNGSFIDDAMACHLRTLSLLSFRSASKVQSPLMTAFEAREILRKQFRLLNTW